MDDPNLQIDFTIAHIYDVILCLEPVRDHSDPYQRVVKLVFIKQEQVKNTAVLVYNHKQRNKKWEVDAIGENI